MSIPGLSFDHLYETSLPHLRFLMDHGGLGAMNLRTGGGRSLANSYATLAAGRRVSVPKGASFYQVNERVDHRPASAWVRGRIGLQPQHAGVVYPALVPFIQENQVGEQNVAHVMLGETLRKAGFHTAVWGNADQQEGEEVRVAPFLTMDRYGQTREAAIAEKTLIEDAERPYGVKTDYHFILQQVRDSTADLRVVELGDLYRLHQERTMLTEEQAQAVEQYIMRELDRFIGNILASSAKEDTVWLISPFVEAGGAKWEARLAPTIRYREEAPPGLLSSSTTRRQGIIANVDLAPTVLHTFGIVVPTWMDGQTLTTTSGETQTFWKTLEQVVTVYRLRPLVIYSYAMYQVVVLIIALGLLLSKKIRQTAILQVALLASVLTPVLFLLLAGIPALSTGLFFVLLAISALGAAFLLKKLSTLPLFFVLGLIGFIPIIADGITGGYLIRQSFLGYDPVIGARYYGIGNEYMGVVLGSVILMIAAVLEWRYPVTRWVKGGIALLFLLLVLYFSAPFLGTNAGGALAAAVGFGVAYVRFFHSHWGLRFWFALAGLGLAGVGVLFVMNGLFPVETPSHIGRAFSLLMEGDIAEVLAIAKRKLSTNIRLIKASLWGRVFFISLLAMAVLIIQPLRGVRWLQMRYPFVFHGFTAILIAALSALVFNDSGIVSAATAIVYVVIPLLIIVCRDWTPKHD